MKTYLLFIIGIALLFVMAFTIAESTNNQNIARVNTAIAKYHDNKPVNCSIRGQYTHHEYLITKELCSLTSSHFQCGINLIPLDRCK